MGCCAARSWSVRETDFTALLDDFANTTNVAATPLTWALLVEAINQLETRDQEGQVVVVLDPTQVGQVRNDIGTNAAAMFGNPGSLVPADAGRDPDG